MPRVDYQGAETARQYSQGRDLADNVLERWHAAVAPHLPNRAGLEVLDLGAGTGIFARAWPTWVPCRVIAIEPAGAMRAEMVAHGVPGSVCVVGARAEQVPLAPASVDVVWLSAVIHHFGDLDGCAEEIDRVLVRDGAVLVRGLFADLGTTPAIEIFPGSDRAVAAFPSVSSIQSAFEHCGLGLMSTVTVEDAGPATAAQLAERVRRLRSADTLLAQFTDEEIAQGLASIDAMGPSHPIPPARLGLLTFQR